jgi:hypothetical protein
MIMDASLYAAMIREISGGGRSVVTGTDFLPKKMPKKYIIYGINATKRIQNPNNHSIYS